MSLRAHLEVQIRPTASQNQRRAAEALRKLNLIDKIETDRGPVRNGVEAVLVRCVELLGGPRARALVGTPGPSRGGNGTARPKAEKGTIMRVVNHSPPSRCVCELGTT